MGKRKKEEKFSGLCLSRIGASLVPNAIFAAVPTTVHSFTETWPRRKKNLNTLSTALGSIGNIAQAVVVSKDARGFSNSNKLPENENSDYDDNSGHYAVVDENILYGQNGGNKDDGNLENYSSKPALEPIYAKVNKNRKPEKEEEMSNNNLVCFEEDITSISCLSSNDDDVLEDTSRLDKSTSKSYFKKRKSHDDVDGAEKGIRTLPATINEKRPNETDIPEKITECDDRNLENDHMNKKSEDNYVHRHKSGKKAIVKFEDTNSSPRKQAQHENVTKRSIITSAPDVSSLGERERPIGKGVSTESIHERPIGKGVSTESIHERPIGKGVSTESIHERPIGKGVSTESIQDIYPLDLGKEFVDSFEETAHKQRTTNYKAPSAGRKEKRRKNKNSEQVKHHQQHLETRLLPKQSPKHLSQLHNGNELAQEQTKDVMIQFQSKQNLLQPSNRKNSQGKYVPSKENLVNHSISSVTSQNIQKPLTHESELPLFQENVDVENKKKKTSSSLNCMSTRTENGVRQKRTPKHEAVDLGEENTTLNILKLLPSESADYSTHASNKLLQMQMEELKNENNILKDSVERLNFHVQLGSYQTTNAHNSFRDEVNMKYITPLLLAYDDQIKQKEAIIESYKEQFKKLKDKVQILVNENVQLREEKLNNSKRLFRDEDERKKLEEQAELVLTENDLLMKRHDIQKNKLDELVIHYNREISNLSEQCETARIRTTSLESQIKTTSSMLDSYKIRLEEMQCKEQKYLNVINDYKRKLDELQKTTESEIKDVCCQNKRLTKQLADYKLVNNQLENEILFSTEVQRRHKRKTLILQEKLLYLQQKEVITHDMLNEVLKLVI